MDNICIPLHLDAFALSSACCDEALLSRIAPYTQPNYTALRLDSHILQHDILDQIDFHNAQPATANPRTANIGVRNNAAQSSNPNADLKLYRMGVHLQWSLPRLYRTGTASGKDQTIKEASEGQDATQPQFRQIPNRWLITRRLKTPQRPKGVDEFTSWIIESDAYQTIKNIPSDVDLESGVSPFVSYGGDPSDLDVLNKQTEVFLGQRFNLEKWATAAPRQYLKGGVTVMTSSNPIFADYALHNTNVLSLIDNFSYPLNKSDGNNFDDHASYLKEARCDYFVLGWHQDGLVDPLNQGSDSIKARLNKLLLKLSPQFDPDTPDTGDAKQFRDRTDPTRCLIHGAIYDVEYNFDKTPATSLAEEGAHKFGPNYKMEPVSLGTTPLDGILTFLDAHNQDGPGAESTFFGDKAKDLPKYVLELSQLLYAAGDNYDSRVEAQDLIAQQNYAKSDGGSHWTYSAGSTGPGAVMPVSDGKPKIPGPVQLGFLQDINELQSRVDVAKRKIKAYRWSLFAEWFKYKSEYIEQNQKSIRLPIYYNRVDDLKKAITKLDKLIIDLDGQKLFQTQHGKQVAIQVPGKISAKRNQVDCKESTKDPFQQRSEPTLTIAGLDSGWPQDVLDTLQIRVDSELIEDSAHLAAVDSIFAATANGRPKSSIPVPAEHKLQATAKKILAECLRDSNATTANGKDGSPSITGFQAWGERNPFAPLFVEWECMYYHIDKDEWNVELRPCPVGHAHPQIRYALKDLLVTSDAVKAKANADNNQNNFRVLSGRALVLPQPRFNLEFTLLQVLDSKSPDIPPDIKDSVLTELRDNIRSLKFISAPLSGLTNHLLTRCEGAHVRPNVRVQGQTNRSLKAADAKEIHMDYLTALPMIDAESALTPYGALMAFGKDEYAHNPFKPVTHGQFMFTKLNVVDKFGQAICLPPRHRRKVKERNPPPAAIHPCLSDYLTPDVVKKLQTDTSGTLNTVFPVDAQTVVDGQWPLCPFVQLTPSINQDARINGSFLTRDKAIAPWREVTEYESPIWGWIIINYADNGLQFFLGDGRFYREIRIGGVGGGTNLSAKWLPYGPPGTDKSQDPFNSDDPAITQMDGLIKLFTNPVSGSSSYLIAFSDMINGAIKNMPFPPSSYAGYANAIVGKPLALVNVGWSIELAEPPIEPQFTAIDQKPGERTWNDPQLLDYVFPVKIGDADRNYDGVIGYFDATNPPSSPAPKSTPQPPKSAPLPPPPTPPTTIWKTLYTYFMPEKNPPTGEKTDAAPFANLHPDNYLQLKPYYIDPEDDVTPNMTSARCSKYTVTSLLVDPYTPIHAYTPILPHKTLTLPLWTIQSAMEKMHAFFRLGPCLVTDDVPTTYTDANALNPDNTHKWSVKLPVSGSKGMWTWLQPFTQDGFDALGNDNPPQFATMAVDEDVGTVKFEPAPYTFLEGYLQLMGRLDNKGDQS